MQFLRDGASTSEGSDLITDFSNAFAVDLEVMPDDIDGLGHMNNAIYVNWLDQANLLHTFHLGITSEVMQQTGCALVVRHTELTYLAPLRQGDVARVGTCVSACDGRLRLQRSFQMVRVPDGLTMLRGTIDYICIDYKKGKPKRMPEFYSRVYSTSIIHCEHGV